MVICFDGKTLKFSKNRGMGNYTVNLIKTIVSMYPENEYVYLSWTNEGLEELGISYGIKTYHLFDFSEGEVSEDILKTSILSFLTKNRIDVFIDTAPMGFPVPYDRLWFNNTFLIGVVYDFIPLIFAEKMLTEKTSRENYLRNLANQKKYDYLIAISENTRLDAVKYLKLDNNQITNCYMDGNNFEIKANDTSEQTLLNFGIEKPYFLSAVWFEYHKNLERILEAYGLAYIEDESIPSLVLTGKVQIKYKRIIEEIIEKYKCTNKIKFVGYVSDTELDDLYRNAEWLIFPSLYEGFGMSVLEAWRKNVPVITSNNSSLGEIARDAAFIVDPYSIHSIKDAILKTSCMSIKERKEYIDKGKNRAKDFSWEKTANKLMNIIQKNDNYLFDIDKYIIDSIESIHVFEELTQMANEKVYKIRWKELLDYIKIDSQIVIFGCGKYGKRIYDSIPKEYKNNIVCFCDNSKGEMYCGKEVLKPDLALLKYKNAFYILAMKNNKKEVYLQLLGLGISAEKILDCDFWNLV